MYRYSLEKLKLAILPVLEENLSVETLAWIRERIDMLNTPKGIQQLNVAFAAMPRKTGKSIIQASQQQKKDIEATRSGFTIKGWSIDRLSRIWLLLHFDIKVKDGYIRAIEGLFKGSEMNEQVALYSALPLFAFPEEWVHRCTEGIRSNIGDVLESVMCNNPYASENLDESAWNQLVLKAFFTGQPVHRIIGLDERSNQKLANTLSDYAHERWAAHRQINPQVWRCVTHFITPAILSDIERIANSEESVEREAAALVCLHAVDPGAKQILDKNPQIKFIAQEADLSWERLANKLEKV